MGSRWCSFIVAIFAIILLFPCFLHSEKAPYETFVKEATSAPANIYYDYIIIGGGTSGCPLAATLSQGAKVLVLERGGSPYDNPNMINLANFITTLSDTSPTSPTQQFTSQDGVLNARACILGGGSALNAGFYTRASTGYIKEVGGWNETLVDQSYEWVEEVVAFEPPMLEWQCAVRDGLLEVGVLPDNGFTYDHLYGTKVGGTIFDGEGHRHTAADLLQYADPSNIQVYLHATVHKILFGHNDAPYETFVKEATSAPANIYYDYIIIGGGTSGCPLAATLSQGAKVLVLERGGSPYDNPNMINLANFITTLSDTSPTSPTQQFTSQDGVLNARARILGGGSALNAGFYTRASASYIKEVGGWNETLVDQSYEWVEEVVAYEPQMLEWQSAVRDGLLEVGVVPDNGFTYDHLYGTKVGGTIFDGEGHRHTAADLLQYADPSNIQVYLHATVHKILFGHNDETRRPQAYGVIFKDAHGVEHRAYLIKDSMNEIILSAGAIGSPQLLMLSGIGAEYQLGPHGIKVVVDLPMVGQGMADNPMNLLFVPSPKPVEVSLIQVVGITKYDSYIEAASGLGFSYSWAQELSRNFGLFINKTGQPFTVTPEAMAKAGETKNAVANATLRGGFILEKISGPISSGHIELLNTNIDDNPAVTFNYFNEPEDLKRCVEGMSTIIDVINSKAFSKFRYGNMSVQDLINLVVSSPVNLRPRHLTSAISLEQFCIDTVMTIWHYHGGCQVGAVVDHDYRVLGVDSLRVIDGSTFLSSPGTNPQATVMMLGRYMGEKILQERYSEWKK